MTKHVVYEIVDEVELDPVGEEESGRLSLESAAPSGSGSLCNEEGRCQ